MIEMSVSHFEELVVDAIDQIPEELYELIDNVVFLVEDQGEAPDVLGLYVFLPTL